MKKHKTQGLMIPEKLKQRIEELGGTVNGVTLDDRHISIEEWERYAERLQKWNNTVYGDSMDRMMSKPKHPNYYRANND